MSATQIPIVQKFIDYLDKHLCDSKRNYSRFKKVAPRCFFYKDERDTIFVKVTDDSLIIITDGENVCDHIEIIYLADMGCGDGKSVDNEEETFNDYLQNIVHKL